MSLPRLIFVTGKGGTGKSTVAAALGLALSRRRPTIIVDLDQRRSAARMLGIGEQETIPSDMLAALSLGPRAEVQAFVERIVPLRMVARRMLKSRTFGYVSAALPGLEAFLMLERLRLLAAQAALEDRYVVVDGPATGGAIELLSVTERLQELAPLGTLNRLAREIEEFLHDANRFGVIIVLRPEEHALREAIESAAAINGKLRIHAIAAILNGIVEPLFTSSELAGLEALAEHARLAERRLLNAKLASRARRELSRASLKVIELPMLFRAAFGRVEFESLANEMAARLHTQ
jgi:anion-transporting  ArsA/GET3 family ATPase